jgi:hypothetical protein
MSTKIYLSRKLESVVSKSLVNTRDEETDHPLGKWTATLFYVSHKKCLLITNSLTRYTIIVDRVTAADFANITDRFAMTLYDQLVFDGIKTDWPTLHRLAGRVDLFSTDNDRKLIGTQNNILQYIDDWKYEFGAINISNRNNLMSYSTCQSILTNCVTATRLSFLLLNLLLPYLHRYAAVF